MRLKLDNDYINWESVKRVTALFAISGNDRLPKITVYFRDGDSCDYIFAPVCKYVDSAQQTAQNILDKAILEMV